MSSKLQKKWKKHVEQLGDIELSEQEIDAEGLKIVAQYLNEQSHKRFEVVELYGNRIGDDGVDTLVNQILNGMNNVHTIKLEFNGIGAQGTKLLAEYAVTRLKTLNLYSNLAIGDEGAFAIADLMQSSKSLEQVDLFGCGISDAGAHALAQALLNNSKITKLEIHNNPIVKDIYLDIVEALLSRNNGENVPIPEFPEHAPKTPITPKESVVVLSPTSPKNAIVRQQKDPTLDHFVKSTAEEEWLQEKAALVQLVHQLEMRNKQLNIKRGKDAGFEFKDQIVAVPVQPVMRDEIGIELKKKENRKSLSSGIAATVDVSRTIKNKHLLEAANE